jgi:hypothetical protein
VKRLTLIGLAALTLGLALTACGTSWQEVATLKGGSPGDAATSRTADFTVNGSVKVTASGAGTVSGFVMPSEAADDAASWAQFGRAIMLTDGGSETFEGLDGSFYVTAGGMGGPWSLTVEATE